MVGTDSIVQVRHVHKYFRRGSERVDVLNGLTLDVPEGEFFGLMGPSGSGKTTLLNLIAGLDKPSEGQVFVAGAEVSRMSEAELARWRTRNIGFIFQFYHLLPVLTAYENLELVNFVDRLAQVTGGIAAYCNAQDLGNLVLDSFVNGRRVRRAL